MSIGHLPTGLCRRTGTIEYLYIVRHIAGTKTFHVIGIDGIGQTELFTGSDLRGSTSCNLLRSKCHDNHQKSYQYYISLHHVITNFSLIDDAGAVASSSYAPASAFLLV